MSDCSFPASKSSLAAITFDSDSGVTLLGYGGFEGTRLVPVSVPEPGTPAMAWAGLAFGGSTLLRWRRRACPPRIPRRCAETLHLVAGVGDPSVKSHAFLGATVRSAVRMLRRTPNR